jgi:ABC-type microcin C transport system permease subunit YejB
MRSYIAKRLLLIVPTLIGAAALVFVIMRVIPGEVALLIAGFKTREEWSGDRARRLKTTDAP